MHPRILEKRLNATLTQLLDLIGGYFEELIDSDAFARGVDAWWVAPSVTEDQQEEEFPLTMSWMLFNWIPMPTIRTSIGKRFRREKGKTLEPLQLALLDSVLEEPFSFFQTLRVEEGHGLELKDLIFDRTVFVLDQQAARPEFRDRIFFARIASAEGGTVFETHAQQLLPPTTVLTLLDFKKAFKKAFGIAAENFRTPMGIKLIDQAIRSEYLTMRAAMLSPQTPTLTNTDGEPLVFLNARFEITDLNTVFDALCTLCGQRSRAEILEHAVRASDGSIRRVEFSWLVDRPRQQNNVVMARITLEPNLMTVSVNSQKRLEAFQEIVAKRCPDAVKFKVATVEDTQAKLAQLGHAHTTTQTPEVDAQAQQLKNHVFKNHMDTWDQVAIPALNGMTARRAVKTPDGRARVEALIQEMESEAGRLGDRAFELSVLQDLRKRLGLERPTSE